MRSDGYDADPHPKVANLCLGVQRAGIEEYSLPDGRCQIFTELLQRGDAEARRKNAEEDRENLPRVCSPRFPPRLASKSGYLGLRDWCSGDAGEYPGKLRGADGLGDAAR